MDVHRPFGKDLSGTLTARPFRDIDGERRFADVQYPADGGLPRPLPISPGQEEPISVFNWFSLVRATWTFILRPIWWLMFKLPMAFVAAQYTEEARRARKEEDEWYHHMREHHWK